MPSLTIRSSKKTVVVSSRSARSMSSASESRENQGAISTKRLRRLWRRKRIVIPAGARSLAGDQRFTIAEAQTPVVPLDEEKDSIDKIVFLNNPTEFDLRSYFFRRPKSALATDRLERSAISQSSVSRRSITREFTSANSNKREIMTFGTKSELASQTTEALAARQARKPRRRLRSKEELCIVLPRSTTRGRTRSQKAWFLGPGFIGREAGDGTFIVTKDKSMDPVHAEISVSGDDYFVRDAQSTMGTFLCLNTRYRHYPQRDGFRLHPGDVFRIGPSTSIRILDLQTTVIASAIRRTDKARSSSSASLTEKKADGSNTQETKLLERTPRTESATQRPAFERVSTVDELRLLAADIEDELMNDVGRNHSSYDTRQEATRQSSANKDTSHVRKPSTASKPRRSVHFSDSPPLVSDGSMFLGSRYIWPEAKELHYHEPSQVEDADDDMIKQLIGSENESHTLPSSSESPSERRPSLVRLAIFQHDPSKASTEPQKSREVTLPGQNTYLIGSSAACDVRIFPSEGIEIRAVHSRIVFDGASFVLQDLSFERDPRRQTRVLLSHRPVRVTRGDWFLLGKCALYVTTVARAFGSERRPDIKEAAMRLDVLRLSKRKPRTRGLFVPVGFRLHSASGSGASSGSSGWGGSSGGPVTFGKGRDCDAQVFTASLATEQFSVQLERGTCLLTPKPTGINAGTYFLIGRDESGPPLVGKAVGNEEAADPVEVVKHTSKPLLLSEGCVFRCGGSELEVIFSKSASARDAKSTAAIEEQQHIQFLSAMPWLKPISSDVTVVANVARCGQRLKLSPGDLIYEKGDPANVVFIVISGEVALQTIADNDHREDNEGVLAERVAAGGFFGEVSLQDPLDIGVSTPNSDDLEYPETARAASSCELLALAREDVCGYLGLYVDVIRAHLRQDKCRDRILRVACSYVPWLRGISLEAIRTLSAHAEVAVYPPGSTLFEDGKLFVPAAFAGGNTFQLRDGILVLSRGNARVVRSKRERAQRKSMKACHADDLDASHHVLEHVRDVDDEGEEEPDEWWSPREPVIAMSSSSSPSVLSFCDLSFRLEAYSTVECYFVAAAHLAHLNVGKTAKQQKAASVEPDAPTAAQIPAPIKRGNSLHVVTRRMHHSQVVTSALHSGDSSMEDEDHNSLDGSDGEGDTTAARRWRRKKRNKQLLEQTVLETRNDAQLPNALVLYVLAGAQRGDIHVVRNVASIGGLLSGADIELNDRYVSRAHAVIEYHEGKYWLYDNGSKWGTFVRLEEDNAVDINPGDVFLAGEVEFTCLASYPERNKPSLCCVM